MLFILVAVVQAIKRYASIFLSNHPHFLRDVAISSRNKKTVIADLTANVITEKKRKCLITWERSTKYQVKSCCDNRHYIAVISLLIRLQSVSLCNRYGGFFTFQLLHSLHNRQLRLNQCMLASNFVIGLRLSYILN